MSDSSYKIPFESWLSIIRYAHTQRQQSLQNFTNCNNKHAQWNLEWNHPSRRRRSLCTNCSSSSWCIGPSLYILRPSLGPQPGLWISFNWMHQCFRWAGKYLIPLYWEFVVYVRKRCFLFLCSMTNLISLWKKKLYSVSSIPWLNWTNSVSADYYKGYYSNC